MLCDDNRAAQEVPSTQAMALQNNPLSDSQIESLMLGGQLALQGLAMVLSAFLPSATRTTSTRDTLTSREACQYLGCGKSKFFRLIKDGDLPRGTKIAGIVQWSRDELTAYKNRQFARQQEQTNNVQRLRLPERQSRDRLSLPKPKNKRVASP